MAFADTADRGFDGRVGEAIGVSDRDMLAAALGVMDATAAARRSAVAVRLLARIEDEAGMRGP